MCPKRALHRQRKLSSGSQGITSLKALLFRRISTFTFFVDAIWESLQFLIIIIDYIISRVMQYFTVTRKY